MNNQIEKIKEVLSNELEVDINSIPDNAELNIFDKWDSIKHIGIVLALENEFGIEVNEETIQKLVSIPDIIRYLSERG